MKLTRRQAIKAALGASVGTVAATAVPQNNRSLPKLSNVWPTIAEKQDPLIVVVSGYEHRVSQLWGRLLSCLRHNGISNGDPDRLVVSYFDDDRLWGRYPIRDGVMVATGEGEDRPRLNTWLEDKHWVWIYACCTDLGTVLIRECDGNGDLADSSRMRRCMDDLPDHYYSPNCWCRGCTTQDGRWETDKYGRKHCERIEYANARYWADRLTGKKV